MGPIISSQLSIPASKTKVFLSGNWLIADFPESYDTLSWAVLGGSKKTSSVVWLQVRDEDLFPGLNPEDYLKGKMRKEFGHSNAVGLLTSANIDQYSDVSSQFRDAEVRCIATVGLNNAVRIGDSPAETSHIGTINLLCIVSHPLSFKARLEALSIAAEARTAAMLESGLISPVSGKPATGTGTDCIVIASPVSSDLGGESYVGKHTALGALLGSSVFESVSSAT